MGCLSGLCLTPLGGIAGPNTSRGRGYVGTGDPLFAPGNPWEAYFPKRPTGTVYSFGLPGEDEVGRMRSGEE